MSSARDTDVSRITGRLRLYFPAAAKSGLVCGMLYCQGYQAAHEASDQLNDSYLATTAGTDSVPCE